MAEGTAEPELRTDPSFETIDPIAVLEMDEESFRHHFRKHPIWRAKRVGMQRNAMVVLGNARANGRSPALGGSSVQ